jgi:hypothetical protein
MSTQLTIALMLLMTVIIDAMGDAFRLRNWQIPHHIFEVIHVALWITLWWVGCFDFRFIQLYIAGRIVLFDIVFNLTAGLSITYIGRSSLYDIILTWFGGWVKQHPIHFVFIFRLMALAWWVGTLLKIL